MPTELGFNVFATDRAGKTFIDLAGKVDTLERKLRSLDRTDVNVTVDIDDRGSSKLRAFVRNLDEADGRMATLVQTGAMLAPALVPLSTVAIPALAGVATQAGIAAAALGVTVTAFSGVGDAVKALQDFKLDPSQTNFDKLREELDKLGPAGQEFAFYLQSIRGDLQRLQDVAQAGLLPGAQEGIEELLQLLPQVERIIGHISITAGDLMADAGDNLNDPRWVRFFDYIDRTATPTLDDMGRTTGNLVESFTNLLMAIDPLSRDFSSGILDWSEGLVEASRNLDDSEGLRDLIDYVQDNGPQALETLGAFGNALLQLVEAAAPVGSVALPILEGLADGFAALVDTPVGPLLIGAAAAIGTVGRSLAVLSALGLRGGDSMLGRVFGGAVTPIREATTALTTVTSAGERARMTATQHAQAEEKRAKAIRGGLAQVGKGAAVIGGLALATSGLAEKTGLSNTMSLALMGTIAGPWGAAIGGGVGLVMDLAAANNDLEDASQRARDAFDDQAFSMQRQHSALAELRTELEEYQADLSRANPFGEDEGYLSRVAGYWDQISNLVTNSSEEQSQAVAEMTASYEYLRLGAAQMYAELNNGDMSMFTATAEELDRFVADVAPALRAAGIDIREAFVDGSIRPEAIEAIRSWVDAMDSAHGKSTAVGEALEGLAGQIETNVTQAEALKTALDALFGVELSQAAATDVWAQSLRDLREQLAETNGVITGNSQKALDNRSAIRDNVQALQDKIVADAQAGVSGAKLVESLMRGREAILDQAAAAGANRGKVEAYLKTLGLTPKNLRTIIETPGLLTAKQRVEALGRIYGLTPKQVRTLISQPGMRDSQADIDRLAKKYDMTPKQVRTLLEAIDKASGTLAAHRAAIAAIPRSVTTTVSVMRVRGQAIVPGAATGGPIDGYDDGGRIAGSSPHKRADNILIAATAGEFMHQVDAVDYYGLAAMHAINDRRIPREALAGYAAGGPIEGYAGGGRVEKRRDRLTQVLDQLRQTLEMFGLDDVFGRTPRNPTAARAREDLQALAESIRDSGGDWTKAMDRTRDRLIKDARALDRHGRTVEKETARRDRLNDRLDAAAQAVEELQTAAEQFGAAVSGNFLTDPFNTSLAGPTIQPTSPALEAARAALGQTDARYAAAVAGGSVYEASKILAEKDQLQAQIRDLEAELGPAIETTVTGLTAWDQVMAASTAEMGAFLDTLKELRDLGLDGALYGAIAQSGDLLTAKQLLATGAEGIESREDVFEERLELAAKLEAEAIDGVFGERLDKAEEARREANRLLEAQNRRLERLEATEERLQARAERHEERMTDLVRAEIRQAATSLRSTMAEIQRSQEKNDRKRGRRRD